jgi:hypothetical protein
MSKWWKQDEKEKRIFKKDREMTLHFYQQDNILICEETFTKIWKTHDHIEVMLNCSPMICSHLSEYLYSSFLNSNKVFCLGFPESGYSRLTLMFANMLLVLIILLFCNYYHCVIF